MATATADASALQTASSTTLGLSIPLTQLRGIALAVVLVAAALTRIPHLATYGFSEDEMNKVQAVEQYRHGRFGANAEHPMLMKLAMWGSVALSERWNAVATAERAITLETAIRIPNHACRHGDDPSCCSSSSNSCLVCLPQSLRQCYGA